MKAHPFFYRFMATSGTWRQYFTMHVCIFINQLSGICHFSGLHFLSNESAYLAIFLLSRRNYNE